MGNSVVKNHFEKIIESYIFGHSFNMFVLIGKKNQNDFDVLYANSLAIEYFSKEVNESASTFFGTLWKPIQRNLRKLPMDSAYKTEIQVLKDKESILFEIDLQHHTDELGHEFICLGLCERMDIVADRESSLMLEHKYTSVIDHNLDPIITIDENFKIVNANRAVHQLFGYRSKELSDRSILDLIGEEEVEEFQLNFRRILNGESFELESSTLFHKNGYLIPTYLKAIPVVVDMDVKEIHMILRDTSIHRENDEKLLYLSYHDQLTGLWNRRAMKEQFVEEANFALKNNENMSIVHIGMDRFKLINESLGQNGGDEILKMVADRLKMICPTSARLYRNSSDEFIVIMKNHSTAITENFSQKVLNDFRKPFYYDHQDYFVSASIGISVYPEDGKALEKLLRKSEQALTYVKERGRAHYRFYRVEMNSVFPDEVLMESHLRRAIELDELAIHYQPQVDLKTGQIGSFEALLRWNNRKFGFVSPAHFIPIAEESGLIHSIGDWVLDKVCNQLKEWQDKQFKPVRIAVNISPKQFRMEDFVEKVKEKISIYGIRSSSLEVEITESALVNINETLTILNELKEIGIVISVDDFGTGYSSLSYLKQYPIDIIKIDRSFIKDIETDVKNEAIAKTIINLAHNLGMEVIAEGVEKDLQASILLGANCQKAQGFLYSKAIPVDELVEKYFAYSM